MLFLFEPPVFNSLLIIIFIVSMLVIYFIMRQSKEESENIKKVPQPIKPADIPKPKEQILPRPQTEEKPKAEPPAPQPG